MKKFADITEDLINLSLPIGMVIAEAAPGLPILCVNDMFVAMLGFSDADELLEANHHSAWAFVSPLDVPRLEAYAATRIGTDEAYKITYRALCKDGSFIWVDQNARHGLDENGREVIFAYCTDITPQKQMEEEIRIGAKKYEMLIRSIPSGVSMYHLDDRLTPIFLSDRVYELCGMTREEYLVATQKSTLDIIHPDDRKSFFEAICTAKGKKRKFDSTHRALQRDGSYRWMRVSGQTMVQDGISVLYAV
ncbi:MAG: PAS domain-containing protein, partial [Pygmaiobacter sp.]